MKCEKSGSHTISYQSLLLSTIVLNDNHTLAVTDQHLLIFTYYLATMTYNQVQLF